MQTKKVVAYSSLVLNLILILILSYFIIKPNDDNNIASYEFFNKTPLNDTFSFEKYLGNVNYDSLQLEFPYEEYIKSERYKDLHAIKNDLAYLDSKYPQNINSLANIEPLYYSLTDSLFNKIGKKFDNYSGDDYIKLFQWAESFEYISLYEPQNKMLYFNVSDYWFQFIVKKMSEVSIANPEVKYDFKYRFLQGKLKEKSYFFSTKVTSKEKVIFNLSSNGWAHLYQASWNQTNNLQKVIFLFALIFTLLSYFITTITLFNKLKKNK